MFEIPEEHRMLQDLVAKFIDRVLNITPEIEAMAGRSASDVGTGGMATKIAAARIAVHAGCHMCIAAGYQRHPIRRIEAGARSTWFMPRSTPVAARKQWIAGTLRPAGAVRIDSGAMRALHGGKSLLPAGVTGTMGRFEAGDTIGVVGADGVEIARGIASYSDVEASRILGRKSGEIESILGYRGRDELIHRDDLVILKHEFTETDLSPLPLGALTARSEVKP